MRVTAFPIKMCETSVLLNEWRCRDVPYVRNPSLHNPDKGVTHDCASILDSIAKGTSCFHYFSHGTSLHCHSFSRMIFTLVVLYTVDINACVEKSSHSCMRGCMSNGTIAVT